MTKKELMNKMAAARKAAVDAAARAAAEAEAAQKAAVEAAIVVALADDPVAAAKAYEDKRCRFNAAQSPYPGAYRSPEENIKAAQVWAAAEAAGQALRARER